MRYLTLLTFVFVIACTSKDQQPTSSAEQQIAADFVGTTYFRWEDTSRIDTYYGGNRIINVQLWYPLEQSIQQQDYQSAPYYFQIEEAFPHLEQWSESDLELVRKIPTSGLIDAPIATCEAKYPLLIFSPGLGGNLSVYSYYAEQLARKGYIVAGVNHQYESEYVIKPDGTVVQSNITFHDSLKTLDIPSEITAERYREVKGVRQEVLGRDLLFCLDQIADIQESVFKGCIDLDKVGSWGHSIGGAAAIYASYLDNRFKAVLNIDGTPPSIALYNGITPPFMFIEDLTDYENHAGYALLHQRRNDFCEKVKGDSYRILFGDTHHNSFLDFNYHNAPAGAEREAALGVLEETNNYMLSFFDQYLKDIPHAIKAAQTDSLEVLVFE